MRPWRAGSSSPKEVLQERGFGSLAGQCRGQATYRPASWPDQWCSVGKVLPEVVPPAPGTSVPGVLVDFLITGRSGEHIQLGVVLEQWKCPRSSTALLFGIYALTMDLALASLIVGSYLLNQAQKPITCTTCFRKPVMPTDMVTSTLVRRCLQEAREINH